MYLKKKLAVHFRIAEKMGRRYQVDTHGIMPELESFLEMRKNQTAFRFFTCVFGQTIYGSSFLVDMFAPGNAYEDTATVFTENDEAFGLFLLEDNWWVWYEAACAEFKKEASDMKLEIPDLMVNEIDSLTSDDSVTGMSESGESQISEYCDVQGFDGKIHRQKCRKKNMTVQTYSSGGMTETGFSRLEELEELVEKDRMEKGKAFYHDLKELLVNQDMMNGEGRKDEGKTRKRLRMR